MACLDTSFLLDTAGRGGRQLEARAREKLAALVEGGEILTTTRFNVAELWVGVERTSNRQGELVAVETMEPLTILDSTSRPQECSAASRRTWTPGAIRVETWTSSSRLWSSCTATDS